MRATAILSLIVIGTSAPAESLADEARTTVKVCVVRDLSDGGLNLLLAERVAAQIVAEAGARIAWHLGEPSRGERDRAIIIDLTSNTPDTLEPGALAYAQAFEGVHIRVFWDRVQNAAGRANRRTTFLLAHVMAHEIVHILECTDRHSKTGLMKARWTEMEIEQMSIRPLSLAPEDVQLIRQGLLKRVT